MDNTIKLFGFPCVVSAADVIVILEAYTGKGTVSSVKFLPPKDENSRASAKIDFTSAESAKMIIQLAADRLLWYGTSYLKARKWERGIAPSSKMFEPHSMELVKLHFGCQVSQENFSVLWTTSDVSVKFGMGFKNIYLFFSHDSVEYKLEVSFGRIELHHPDPQLTKFLLIKLLGGPKIYAKGREASDKNWIREVDFTPSCCIGQSSALCLELSYGCVLPNLRRSFAHYKEDKGEFIVENGNAFSCNSDLVPLVSPPPGINLPYKILFKINSLVHHGCVPGQALGVNFYELVDPSRIRIEYIECALDKLFHLKECCYEPVKWLSEQYKNYTAGDRIPRSPAIYLDEGFAYVHRVQITPSKVYFCGPEVNLSNRVLRNYSQDIENFLRVSFVDEDLGKMFSVDLCQHKGRTEEERRTRVYERILSTLRNGIVIGDKKFEFLAFSSSQLREQSVWMFASRSELTAQDIRNWMGDFRPIRNVAKYAARLGQSFSSSRETFSVGCDEIEYLDDVEIETGGTKYCFSDGIGKISAEFAEKVARKCGLSSTPSAFQIRYGGYKGVVAVDPTVSKTLSLRDDSMLKFKSQNTKLDVLAWSKYQPCFLNRQLITLLSTLGVRDRVFEKKQNQAMDQLGDILTNPKKAQEALELMFHGEVTSILKEMLMCGYKPDAEPFLSLMLQAFCASKFVELRSRTRIFVPYGRSLMGCLDETGTLEYGQVFVQCSPRAIFSGGATSRQGNFVVEGKLVVAKNPCLHPGDVRVLKAVNAPALQHMVDCVVFPQKGKRPHPNECSGSDLDGDNYFVSWDPDLIPPRQDNPMDYSPAPIKELDHDVTIEEVEESFTNYIVNDNLGIISNAHLVFADMEKRKARSSPCMELAKLHSDAVDSPKTGVEVQLPRRLRVKEYPDFMEKLDSRSSSYESKRVIGKLFRKVKDVSNLSSLKFKSFTREVATMSYDPDMEVDCFENYINEAMYYKSEYDNKLGNLMEYYGFETEAEILSGNVTQISKFFNKRKDMDSIKYAVRSLIKEARTWFNENQKLGCDSSESDDNVYAAAAAKASAWYHVTYHPTYWGRYNEGMERDHFLSFPWCVFDKLIQIKTDKTSRRNSLLMSLTK